MKLTVTIFSACIGGLLAAPLVAQENIGLGVPSDAIVYSRWVSPGDDGFLNAHFSGFRDALRTSGALDEFLRLSGAEIEGESAKRHFNVKTKYWSELLSAPSWWKLIENEGAFIMRFGPGGRIELGLLFRIEGTRARDRALGELRNIVRALSALGDEYELIESDRRGVPSTVLYSQIDPGEQICVGGYGDVVVIGTSSFLLRQSLELLEGTGTSQSIVVDSEYRELSRRYPAKLREFGESGGFEFLYRPRGVLEEVPSLNIVRSYSLRANFESGRLHWQSRYEIIDESKNLLAQAFLGQKSVEKLFPFIPAGVSSFTLRAGVEPLDFLEYSLELTSVLTGGTLLSEVMQRGLRSDTFDVKEDILRFLSGRSLSVQFSGSGAGSAYLWELDAAADRKSLQGRISRLGGRASKLGLEFQRASPEISDTNAFEIDTQALLGCKVLLGVSESFAVVATSRAAFESSLRIEKGAYAKRDISTDPKFSAMWVPGGGKLDRVSYGNLGDDLKQYSAWIRTLGVLARLLPANDERGWFKPLLGAVSRLQVALGALDFFEGRISTTRRNGLEFSSEGHILLR